MKYLHTMYDHQLQTEYKLYQANAKEISDRLYKGYGLSRLALQMFNSEVKLGGHLIDIREREAKGYGRAQDDYWMKEVKEITQKIENNEHLSVLSMRGVQFGYELMPIAISTEGDFENPNTKLELVDGFKRMFCMDVVPDVEILVKVYGKLTDKEWINAMIMFNSWKYVSGEGSGKYFDRGFQLGLYYRYQMQFVDMIMTWGDMFAAINLFTSGQDLNHYSTRGGAEGGAYRTFWNNDCFVEDLKAIFNILSYKPVFQIKKRGKPDQAFGHSSKGFYDGGLERVLEVFVSLFGEVRRLELEQQVETRKPFDMSILTDYMADPDIQKHMIKLCQMTVDGFKINYIHAHMREELKERFYKGMGYSYSRPEPKKEVRHEFKINESML